VFFPPSPRHLSLETARDLGKQAKGRAAKVALTVDADHARVASIVEALAPDWLQLHGNETPERLAMLRAAFGLPMIKAIALDDKSDLLRATAYRDTADKLLFDARPPKGSALPGGNGLSFDWGLLRDYAGDHALGEWMLSGGLTPDNVGEAIDVTRAPGVDVSSGVEDAPGVKNPEKIHAFIAAARKAQGELA
jgi:phosphoribosylanthranilate isomerase